MISKKDIQQLKKIYIKEFGEEISDEQIIEYAQVMLNLLTVVYKKDE